MRLSIIKLFGACSLLLLVSCSSTSTEELTPENQSDGSTSSIEQIDNDTVPEQESSSVTSSETNPEANPVSENGSEASNNSFSRRVSSKQKITGEEKIWQSFYFYDGAGKLVTEERRYESETHADDILTYEYNVDGLLTAIDEKYGVIGDGTFGIVDRRITFEYDEQGRVISRADDSGNTGERVNFYYYSYDDQGRLAEFNKYEHLDGGAVSFTGNYIYDENNVRTGMILYYWKGDYALTQSYVYTEAGELETKYFGGSTNSSEHYIFEDGPCSSAHLILDDDVLCR